MKAVLNEVVVQGLLNSLKKRKKPIAVVGLGYVGLPLAVYLSRKYEVIGFDIDTGRIGRLKEGFDDTGEINAQALAEAGVVFTDDPSQLAASPFIIVAVPTPIDEARNPELGPLRRASKTVGTYMVKGTVVVYESTVYPGATEEVCLPVLQRESGLKAGIDFFLGYSPERINPGDKIHSFEKVTKVVSGENETVCNLLAEVYSSVITAGIYKAASIKIAEAAKVIENTQRDLNIALMNELAIIFNRLGIDTHAVLEAAGTKWNFMPFMPGLVGGHCIGVDPYYLTYQAERVGYHPEVILAGRRINDAMSKYVAEQTIKQMMAANLQLNGARVLVLGLTFKENVPDLRNSKVIDLVRELRDYQMEVLLHDPLVGDDELFKEYGERKANLTPDLQVDAVVFAVKHNAYQEMGLPAIAALAKKGALIMDVKGAIEQKQAHALGLAYWRL